MTDRIGRIECRSQLAAIGKVSHDGKQCEEGAAERHLPRLDVTAGELDEGLHCQENNHRADLERNTPHRVSRSRPHVLNSWIAVWRQEDAPDSAHLDCDSRRAE